MTKVKRVLVTNPETASGLPVKPITPLHRLVDDSGNRTKDAVCRSAQNPSQVHGIFRE
jgi:hypothetical protein